MSGPESDCHRATSHLAAEILVASPVRGVERPLLSAVMRPSSSNFESEPSKDCVGCPTPTVEGGRGFDGNFHQNKNQVLEIA